MRIWKLVWVGPCMILCLVFCDISSSATTAWTTTHLDSWHPNVWTQWYAHSANQIARILFQVPLIGILCSTVFGRYEHTIRIKDLDITHSTSDWHVCTFKKWGTETASGDKKSYKKAWLIFCYYFIYLFIYLFIHVISYFIYLFI